MFALVEVEPNGIIPRHTHPGVESSDIVSGSGTLSVRGQPDRVLKAGVSRVPAATADKSS
jgi:quercetin dioxygenase-like cupin family protein